MLLGTIASHGLGARGGSYDSIATVTVGAGGTSSVEFTSIPATYKHLQIRILSESSYTAASDQDSLSMRLNNDSTSNYSYHAIYGNGTGITGWSYANQSYMTFWTQTNPVYPDAVRFTVGIIDILDYANTNIYKTLRGFGGNDTNNSGNEVGRIYFSSGNWRNTDAITSIKLQSGGMDRGFAQYSHFALYGIKA